MAETVGSLVDKISIMELKIFHMKEQVDRPDASPEHIQACRRKMDVLKEQRHDLGQELSLLFGQIARGEKKLKVYRQFKMYNDPIYRLNSAM
jgi:hypothetical protein